MQSVQNTYTYSLLIDPTICSNQNVSILSLYWSTEEESRE